MVGHGRAVPRGAAPLPQRRRWYLMIAEGGTERGHGISIARGDSPEGPFETAPRQPAAHAPAAPTGPIQNTGHGDLVVGPGRRVAARAARRAPAQHDPRLLGARAARRSSRRCTWEDDGWPAIEPVLLNPRPGTRVRATTSTPPSSAASGSRCAARPRSVADLDARPGSARAARRRLDARRPAPGVPRAPPGAPDAPRHGRGGCLGRRRRARRALRRALPRRRSRPAAGRSSRAARHRRTRAGVERPFDGQRPLDLRARLQRAAPTSGPVRARTSDIIQLAATIDGERIVLAEVDGRFLSVGDHGVVHGAGDRRLRGRRATYRRRLVRVRRRRRMTDAAPRAPDRDAARRAPRRQRRSSRRPTPRLTLDGRDRRAAAGCRHPPSCGRATSPCASTAGDSRARRRGRSRRSPRARRARCEVRATADMRRPRRAWSDAARRSPPGSSPTATGSPSRSASPTPSARRSPLCVRTTFTVDAAGAPRDPVLDGARRRRARAQRRRRVDDDVLAPGWTSYRDRLVHETRRRHRARARGRRTCSAPRSPAPGTPRSTASSSSPTASTATSRRSSRQLRVEYEDGTHRDDRHRRRLAGRRRRPGRRQRHLRRRARTTCACADRRLVDPGFDAPAGRRCASGPSARAGYEHVPVPEARIAPPVRRIEELPVAEVLTSPSGATILDFGQNLVGRLRHPGRRARPARASRCGTPRCSRTASSALRPLRNAAATDALHARRRRRGDAGSRGSRSTASATRDRRLAGRASTRPPSTAVVLAHRHARAPAGSSRRTSCSTGCTRTSCGACAATSSTIPTDCPQRDERLGWTGDIQVFAPDRELPRTTATAFLTSWLRDLALEQRRATASCRSSCRPPCPSFGVGRPDRGLGRRRDHRAVGAVRALRRRGRAARRSTPSMRDWVDAVLAVAEHAGLWARLPARRLARPRRAAGQARQGEGRRRPRRHRLPRPLAADRRRCRRGARRGRRRRALRDARRAQPARRSSPST